MRNRTRLVAPAAAIIERAGVSAALARAIHASLSFDPDERPTSQQLADELGDGAPYADEAYA